MKNLLVYMNYMKNCLFDTLDKRFTTCKISDSVSDTFLDDARFATQLTTYFSEVAS